MEKIISSYSDIQAKTTADTTGVFNLSKLGYSTGYYFLVSPSVNYTISVFLGNYDGRVGDIGYGDYGVRPVVSMSGVQMEKTTTSDGNILWKIK